MPLITEINWRLTDRRVFEQTIKDHDITNPSIPIEWDGIQMFSNEEKIMHIFIDNSQLCCEDWGILVNGKEIEDIESKTWTQLTDCILNYIKINVKREKRENQNRWKDRNLLCVDLYLKKNSEEEIVELDFYCDHNGYYPHTIWTWWSKPDGGTHDEEYSL